MRLKYHTLAAVFVLGAAAPAVTIAAGDAEAGKAKAAVCAACHGKNGIAAIPGYPNLARPTEEDLVCALTSAKPKQRNGGAAALMHVAAAGLSDEDIANLAAYYASLPADGGE